MNRTVRILVLGMLVFSAYHLVRDVLQTLGLDSALTDVLHRQHQWCGQYCNVVTWPLDVVGVVSSVIILRRNHFGLLGLVLVGLVPLWILMTLLP